MLTARSRHRPVRTALLTLVPLGAALATAGGAQAAEAPSFQCRASALAASVANQPYVEPLVANGLRGSVPGPVFDKAACSNDEQGAGDLTDSAGIQGLVGTSAVQVRTTLTPETGSSKAQTATASTTIADVDLRALGAAVPNFLRIGAVKATASARCVNGKAELAGSSEITDVRLLGQAVSLDGLVNGLGDALSKAGLDAVVKIYPLNQVTKTADSVVVTPLRIQVLSGGNSTGGVLDITVGETKVAQRGDACNPPAVNADDPTTGGDGICPVGSIPVGEGPRVCQIPATDRYGLVVIGVPNSTDTPRGGRVLPLVEARRLAAAGLLPNSKCLSGAGLDYVVLGDQNKNRIYGTKNADRIMGLGKTDALSGLDAQDCLDGGSGNDRLYGGTADDRLYGGTGKDHVYGENGDDRLYGGASRDYLYGDKGDDVLEGESGSDLLVGGAEDDTLRGADGNDELYGQDGRDRLDGGVGDDRLSGGYNTNTLIGGAGRSLVVNGKPSGAGHTTIDLRAATKPSVVKCGSRRDVVLVNRTYAGRNRYSSNCTTIRVSR